MKKLFSFLFYFFIIITVKLHAQSGKKTFQLKGNIQDFDTGIIYLSYYNTDERKGLTDSSVVSQGRFNFLGSIREPIVAFITLDKGNAFGANATNIFLEASEMNISLKFNKFNDAHLTGSITQKEYENLQALGNTIKEKYKQPLDQYLDEKFSDKKDSLSFLLQPLFDSLRKIEYAFFEEHPTSYVTVYLLQYHIRNLSVDSLILFYNRLGYELQQNIVARRISERIKQKQIGSIGSIANPFEAKDINGNYLISKLFKGKYLLLDFWASWCVPCRKNNPHLIELYNLYYKKGLRIIGIAGDDRDTSAWKKAIKIDGIGIWNHVLRGVSKEARLKGIKNNRDIHEKYNVELIPTLILINPDGIIIGRFQEKLDELDRLLATIFKLNPTYPTP